MESRVGGSFGTLKWREVPMPNGISFVDCKKDGFHPMPPPNVPSVQIYGTCEEIIFRTDDNYTLIDEIPDPNTLNWVRERRLVDSRR